MLYKSLTVTCLMLSVATVAVAQAQPATTTPLAAPPATPVATPVATAIGNHYVPHRAYDSKRKRFSDFESMLAQLARADVVFLGEQHDDPRTHRLQLAVLEGLARRREGPIVLSLEMFERDVQPTLDAYLAGSSSESTFIAGARPWPNYAADYRPMVEFAREQNWPVLAANVPRRLAQVVSRRGMGALDSLPAADRDLIAPELSCPRDSYFERFRGTMGDMAGHGAQLTPDQATAMVLRFYEAQCVKDETMAESIADAARARRTLVVHMNGAFHSDYGLGTAARVKWRLPRARLAVVSFVPVADLDVVDGGARRKLGEWVVFTLATPKPPATERQP